MKETASQSDKANRRYTCLKLGVLNKKLDKLSRYLNLNDRKRLTKSRYSKTFQLRFVSTKTAREKLCT